MIKHIKLTGVNEGIKYLTNVTNNFIPKAMEGIEESVIMLKDEIENTARIAGYDEYADSLEWEINREQWYGIVGPTVDYAPLIEMGETAKYIHARCPWWKYLETRLRARVPSFPMLEQIAMENTDRIKEILISRIREAFR